jgi:hypothetical protein
MKNRFLVAALCALALGWSLTGCKDGETPEETSEEKKVLIAFIVEPASLSMAVGDKQTVTATPVPADATDVDFQWSSEHNNVATVTENPTTGEVEVEAKSVGETSIVVSSGSLAPKKIPVTVAAGMIALKTPADGVEIDANSSTGFPVEFTWETVAVETGGYILKTSIDASIPDDEEKTKEIVVNNTTGAFELTKAMAEEMFVDLPRFTTLYWTVVPKTASAPVATQIRTVKAARKLNIAGQWEFEDGSHLGSGTAGGDLTFTDGPSTFDGAPNAPGSVETEKTGITQIDGPGSTKAVQKGKGAVMEWRLPPDWTPKGNEQKINEYTLVFDVRISYEDWRSLGQWYNEKNTGGQTETDIKNSDGELFIHGDRIGILEMGYSTSDGAGTVPLNQWTRLIFSMNIGVAVNYYLNGVRVSVPGNPNSPGDVANDRKVTPSTKDGRFALPDKIWFFHDGHSEGQGSTDKLENWMMDVAEIIVYKEALSDEEVAWLQSRKGW